MKWIESYLENRTYSVIINSDSSEIHNLIYGVPQGSILAPLLFTLYISELSSIVLKYNISIHTYADDTNLYMGFQPVNNFSISMHTIKTCLDEVKSYMSANYLKLNVDKTQVVFCGHETNLKLHRPRSDELEELEEFLGPEGHELKSGKYFRRNF